MHQIFAISDTDVSQDSSATHVRCGEIVDGFCCIFTSESVTEKTLKMVNILRSYGQYYSGLLFLTHNV